MSAYNWVGGVGSWSNGANWNPGGPPVDNSYVSVTGYGVIEANYANTTTDTVALDRTGSQPVDLNAADATYGNMTLVDSSSGIGMLALNDQFNGNTSVYLGQLYLKTYHASANVNNGLMAASGGIGTASIFLNAEDGAFRNAGVMLAQNNGWIDWDFAPPSGNPQTTMVNEGKIEAGPGGSIDLAAGHSWNNSYGTIGNEGTIEANGGTVNINSTIAQTAGAMVFIHGGGTVIDNDIIEGSKVEVSGGTLEFGGFSPAQHTPYGASELKSLLDLEGSGVLAFEQTQISAATFNPANNTLAVQANGSTFATFNLTSTHPIAQADFAVSGNNVLFNVA